MFIFFLSDTKIALICEHEIVYLYDLFKDLKLIFPLKCT